MKYFIGLSLIFLITSCHNNNDNNADAGKMVYDTSAVNPAEKISACYESMQGKDTVYLSLFSASKIITGALQYRYFQKDKNSGTLSGVLHGDTLLADYIFMSEGKMSEREVAFLKQDSNYIEGYGAMEEKNGRTVFLNSDSLHFSGVVLQPVNCN